MVRPRNLAILAGAAAAAVAVMRHGRQAARGHTVAGGILIGHAGVYDTLTRLLLGPLYRRIAADVAAAAPAGAQVLEVGCGPGHLSIQLARHHAFEVTGLDLDPAMIDRARANVDRPGHGDPRRPTFLVGDVAALAFPNGSFDLVVSTLSMHHWADPTAGPAEIGRVLRPGGRRSSGTSGPGSGPIRSDHGTPSYLIRSSTPAALRSGWRTPHPGPGPGGSPSPSGSSWSAPMDHPLEFTAACIDGHSGGHSTRPQLQPTRPHWAQSPPNVTCLDLAGTVRAESGSHLLNSCRRRRRNDRFWTGSPVRSAALPRLSMTGLSTG